jgi:hypothetical protein
VRAPGAIKEGDLIGYQGRSSFLDDGLVMTTTLHVGVYDSGSSFAGTDQSVGVLTPTTYFNAYVEGPDAIATLGGRGQDYPFICKQTPVGMIESPRWNSQFVKSTTLSGFALDRTNVTQTIGIASGIDAVKLFMDGYDPTLGTTPTVTGTLLTTINVFGSRPDIQAIYGNQVGNTGWGYNWDLTGVSLGRHGIYMYAHQVTPNKWLLMDVRFINVVQSLYFWLPITLR